MKILTKTRETSLKARKRHKHKTNTMISSTTLSTIHIEGKNKDERNPIRVPPVTHPKSTTKYEPDLNQQQTKIQTKSSQITNKQTLPICSSAATKTSTQTISQQYEQPFTVVSANRHKTTTPPLQRNKLVKKI